MILSLTQWKTGTNFQTLEGHLTLTLTSPLITPAHNFQPSSVAFFISSSFAFLLPYSIVCCSSSFLSFIHRSFFFLHSFLLPLYLIAVTSEVLFARGYTRRGMSNWIDPRCCVG